MNDFFQNFSLNLLIQVSLTLVFTTAIGFASRRALGKIAKKESTPDWLKTLSEAFYMPSAWLIWVYGTLFAIEILFHKTTTIIIPSFILGKIRNLFFVGLFTWILLKWKNKYEKVLAKRFHSKRNDEAVIYAIGRVSTIFILTVSALIVMEIMGIPPATLLAFGGVGGIAIGWAAKDIVANFFGGLMIHLNRPFVAGDWIMSPNKHFEGTVEEIGWYMTRIRTFERRPTFIPNSILLDAIIENPQRMYNRRIKETIGIRYEDASKLKTIVDDIKKMLKAHPAIDLNQTLFVHFVNFGPSSLDIEVYTFTKTTDWEQWRDEQQDIFLKIIEIIEGHGAQIAYPTRSLHIEQKPDVYSEHEIQAARESLSSIR